MKTLSPDYSMMLTITKGAKAKSSSSSPLRLDPNSHSFFSNVSAQDGLCSDCTILSGQISLTLENGTKAETSNGIYLHHVLTRDMSKNVPDFISKSCSTGRTRPQRPRTGNTNFSLGAEFVSTTLIVDFV
jgi:hypothetical protein